MVSFIHHNTPLGVITLEEEDGALTALTFGATRPAGGINQATPLLLTAAHELDEYFAGTRRHFDLPIHTSGTPFQQKCWQVLCRIPYGQTISYSEQASLAGNPKACRAVGMANHRNPLPIIIPCHRVIGKNGALAGYGSGIGIKQFLLQLETGKDR